jgi:hypothetical protein
LGLPWYSRQFQSLLLTSQVFFQLPGTLGVEVDVAQDDSGRGCFAKRLYMVAKPSHVGVDVDGLACLCFGLRLIAARLGDKAYLPGAALSCRCSRRWCLLEDVKLLRHRYLMEG